MVAFGLVAKEYASIRGVAMEPSAFSAAPTFTLFKDAQLMRRVRCEGAEGNGGIGGLCKPGWEELVWGLSHGCRDLAPELTSHVSRP